MTLKITRDILEGYLNCKYKGWLRLSGKQGQKSDYEVLLAELRTDVRLVATREIVAQHPEEVAQGVSLTDALLKRGPLVILDAILEGPAVSLRFDGAERVQGPSRLGDYHYVPVLFHEGRHVRREQRQMLELYGLFLSTLQGRRPAAGSSGTAGTARLPVSAYPRGSPAAHRVLRELRDIENTESPPEPRLERPLPHLRVREVVSRQGGRNGRPEPAARNAREGDTEVQSQGNLHNHSHSPALFDPRRRGKRVKEPDAHPLPCPAGTGHPGREDLRVRHAGSAEFQDANLFRYRGRS